MPPTKIDPLLLSAKTICWIFFIILAAVSVLLIVAAVGFPAAAMLLPPDTLDADMDLTAAQAMIVGLSIASAAALTAMVAYVLRQMIHIIDSVGGGDPFIPENANRLQRMAWALLAAYLTAYLVVAGFLYMGSVWGDEGEAVDLTIDVLDPASLLTILILFILARVFRQGAAMRAELEGTV